MTEPTFTLRAWGDGTPTVCQLADELERIAEMLRTGTIAGDAMLDEDFDGQGWWEQVGFVEPDLDRDRDGDSMVACECGADVDTSIRGQCDECGRSVLA